MKRMALVVILTLIALPSGGSTDRRQESTRELEAGRALLEKLQKASGLDQAILAGRVKAAFEKAVELDPDNIDAREALAGYYINAPFIAGGSFKKARKQAEAITALNPLRGNLLMAEIHLQEKEWPEAEAAFKRAAAIDPSNARVQFSLGRVYQEMERWPEAWASLEKAVQLDPQHAQAWYQLGRTGAVWGQKLERALEALDVYLEKFGASGGPVFQAGAWWRRGLILEKQGRKEEAIASYRKSLEIRPDDRVAAALNGLVGK
jgi:tetratricopeptide (TPR) repeat protein